MKIEPLERRRLLSVDLLSDAAGLSAANSVTVDGSAYFFADNGTLGREPWKSDGTAAGTKLVKDLTPGAASTELHSIYRGADDRAVFITRTRKPLVAGYVVDDFAIWSTDGTEAGTLKLADLEGAGSVMARQVGDRVALLTIQRSSLSLPDGGALLDAHLYFTDGTAAGTSEVKSFVADPGDEQSYRSYYVPNLLVAGERVIFYVPVTEEVWATDGTAAGTVNLAAVFGDALPQSARAENMTELNGKVLIPGEGGAPLWLTDGTIAGTVSRPFNIEGVLEGAGYAAVLGDKYVFLNVIDAGNSVQKHLTAMDLESGAMTKLFSTAGDGSDNHVWFQQAGSQRLFLDQDIDSQTCTLWITDGTTAGTVKLASFGGNALVSISPVTVAGNHYFIVGTGPRLSLEPSGEDAYGYIGATVDNWRRVSGPGASKLDLWRSDGTAANTAKVTTLWEGDPSPNHRRIVTELSEASQKLLVHHTIASGFALDYGQTDQSKVVQEYDNTTAYDPRELLPQRQAASARLVNGVLRVDGSLGDDTIKVFRRASDPDELVDEYNGNTRGFALSSIRRIVADLQNGSDYFEILEGEGGQIRTRTSVLAGDGNDTIITGTGRDTIVGGHGADVIRARGNGDIIIAGSGRDRINAGAGADQISGGSGDDRITSSGGVDVLFGQNAVEKAFGRDLEGESLDEDVLLA